MLPRLLIVLILGTGCLAADWKPITPEELALKKSAMDPGADAEAFFREVRVRNEASTFGYPTNVISEYVRLKIFTDRGKEKYGTVQIPYYGKSSIGSVEGRTIRPDGSIVNMSKDAIFNKVVERKSGFRTKVVSFALPAVEAGAIIEYRWTNDAGDVINRYVPLDVQSEFPTDLVDFHVKPATNAYVQWPKMRYMAFGCDVKLGPTSHDGYTEFSVQHVPAFHEEPFMPPEYSAKQWILVYYEEDDHSNSDAYWRGVGHNINAEYGKKLRVNGEVKSLAAQITEGAKSDDEKLLKLAQYCRKNIKDVHGEEITSEAREKAKENRTSADTLKQGEGTQEDAHVAFLALALAAGFDARIAKISDTGIFIFHPSSMSAFFLDTTAVAVNVGGKWKFYDIPDRNVPIGSLPWRQEGTPALLVNSKDSQFVTTPMTNAETSRMHRIGTFTISAEGDLEGDVREIYMGHEAELWRERFALANDEERAEAVRQNLKQRFADFEAENIKFTAPPDTSLGVSLVYHIKVRGYAQRTGKRLFLLPGYFEQGFGSRFTEVSRQAPIYFRYPWSEMDVVSIQLPEGYSLDHGDAPAPVKFLPIGQYSVTMGIDKSNKLTYNRSLIFGSDTMLMFDSKAYPTVKQIFESIHAGDTHMLTLLAQPKTAQAPAQVQ